MSLFTASFHKVVFSSVMICLLLGGYCFANEEEDDRLEEEFALASKIRPIAQQFKDGKKAEAFQQISKLIEQNKSKKHLMAILLNFRGEMYHYDSQFQKAADDYSQLIKDANGKSVDSRWFQKRGMCYFNLGEFKNSVADFDSYLEKNPEREAHHWQRGISHYYAKMYKQGRKQFENHQNVNSQDVENAVWHFLCSARETSPEDARKNWITIKSDSRIPLMKVQDLFLGKATADDVIKAANENAKKVSVDRLKTQNFYAHLYIGLYFEAIDKPDLAEKHMKLAAQKYSVAGYMGDVAKVHYRLFQKDETKKSD